MKVGSRNLGKQPVLECGLYVAVQPSGAIVFRYDYRLNGRRETVTLG